MMVMAMTLTTMSSINVIMTLKNSYGNDGCDVDCKGDRDVDDGDADDGDAMVMGW